MRPFHLFMFIGVQRLSRLFQNTVYHTVWGTIFAENARGVEACETGGISQKNMVHKNEEQR